MSALRCLPLAIAMILASCVGDETVAAYGGAGRVWTLTELNGQPFEARASLHFPGHDRIAGQTPCAAYSATMDAPYPWFDVQDLEHTASDCPDVQSQDRFLNALKAASLSEALGRTLVLSNERGLEMVFRADE